MFWMGFCLLSAMDFSGDGLWQRDSSRTQQLCCFQSKCTEREHHYGFARFLFFFSYKGVFLQYPHIFIQPWNVLVSVERQSAEKPKKSRLSRMSFRWWKEATHRSVKSKIRQRFRTPLHSELIVQSNAPICTRQAPTFLPPTALECDNWS